MGHGPGACCQVPESEANVQGPGAKREERRAGSVERRAGRDDRRAKCDERIAQSEQLKPNNQERKEKSEEPRFGVASERAT